jgi:hypothetical protein
MLLVGLVRLLIVTNKPLLCSGIYATIVTAGALIGGAGIAAFVAGGIALVFTSVYFWLLNLFEDSPLFWVIMVVGALIGVV